MRHCQEGPEQVVPLLGAGDVRREANQVDVGIALLLPSGPVTAGLQQTFQNADILRSTKSGTHVVSGPILTLYQSLGGADSALGMPASDQYAGTLGPQVNFQLGSIVYVTALRQAVAL